MQEAVDWLLRLDGEDSTESVLAEWLGWYESDARNRQAFDEIRDFWLETGRLKEVPGFDARSMAEDGTKPLGTMAPTRSRRSTLSRNWHSRRPAQMWRRAGAALAAALLLVSIGVVSLRLWQEHQASRSIISAAVPSVRHARLPDGSAVDLAPDSILAIEFTPGERTIDLQRGEAFFSVAPNRSRPFVVKAQGLRVRAVGTEFNVRQSLARVTVTVSEGIVDIYGDDAGGAVTASRVSGGAGLLRLSAGNQVVWDERTGERIVRSTDPERAVAWRSGRLEYIDEPLAGVVADVNRYGSRQIVIQDRGIGQLIYTGTVFTAMLDEWLQALPSEFPVRVIEHGSSVRIVPSTEPMQAENPSARP